MGKKRRGPSLDEVLERPWCYYCERDFDDLKILTLHQKAKHFKCERCGRRLNTAGGLSVHMSQVHKEQLTEIENALPNRAGLDVEIFGMEGVPDDVLKSHQQRVMTQFQQAEAERQAATAGGSAGGQPAKKPKLENMSEMKRRLAEHRAKRAEGTAGGSSGDVTPVGAGQNSPAPVTYGQPQPVGATPVQQHPYPQPYGGATAAAPYQQTASPGYPSFSPPSGQQILGAVAYPPTGYSPQPFPGAPPAPGYGATPSPFPQQPTPTDSNTPPRQGSLPIPAGLPQRPAFGAPSVNSQQMQQMHMGHQIPPVPGTNAAYTNGEGNNEVAQTATGLNVDELISGAAKEAAASKTTDPSTDKPSKKDKSKPTRMIYSHETVSPEERMAQLPRYAFDRAQFPDNAVLGELPASAVTGVIRDENTVLDSAQ
ncbi:hypothetical protein N7509_003262 [Penicillium cosmopolitanum]|uniref:C2H2-type domain-containing protein n=1 Tax=Penicillium cosmopolitanum TaxID=1131564 RepID=A0A9X0BB67_9EURO|nr:uncharacterized protein N7509_003262 [Penicillium cosmopolitanum]KAJ5403391.1 hypothetical protein N7509_003262 [Penicillium cosmopolitanum]